MTLTQKIVSIALNDMMTSELIVKRVKGSGRGMRGTEGNHEKPQLR
jgi:hypothetical protein